MVTLTGVKLCMLARKLEVSNVCSRLLNSVNSRQKIRRIHSFKKCANNPVIQNFKFLILGLLNSVKMR